LIDQNINTAVYFFIMFMIVDVSRLTIFIIEVKKQCSLNISAVAD